MFRIVSRRSRQRDLHTARMQEVPMRPFASSIDEPMLFQIRDELPNLARHIKLALKTRLQINRNSEKVVPVRTLRIGSTLRNLQVPAATAFNRFDPRYPW